MSWPSRGAGRRRRKPVLRWQEWARLVAAWPWLLLPRRVGPGYLHHIIEERRPRAEVGQAGTGRGVAVSGIGRILVPPYAGCDHGALLDGLADAGAAAEAAAVVEDAHPVAIADVACRGIELVDF